MAHKPLIKRNKGQIEEERALVQARPNLGRKRNVKDKDPDSPTPQKVKNKQQKHTARLDRLTGNGKHMNFRQTIDSHGSGAWTRFRHQPLVPNQYRHGGP